MIIGQRNVLTHEYGEILHEAIWAVATRRAPELIAALRKLLPENMENE
ncbi:MAG: HepT-like ribonuclease domain-containing protein [Candidatus Hydrogenedentota bacterium]